MLFEPSGPRSEIVRVSGAEAGQPVVLWSVSKQTNTILTVDHVIYLKTPDFMAASGSEAALRNNSNM